jgi:hypothetical protein
VGDHLEGAALRGIWRMIAGILLAAVILLILLFMLEVPPLAPER